MRSIVCSRNLLGFIILCWSGSALAAEIRPDLAMDSDPALTLPPSYKTFEVEYQPLWLEALSRPEADMQRHAAETIARAHAYGFPRLAPAAPRLIEIVSADATHPATRFAAARALIILDARDAAPVLFDAAGKRGADLRRLVEPALGSWGYEPVRDLWRSRLADQTARHRDLIAAIDGLGEFGDVESADALLAIVHDSLRPASVRLAAARSAGRIRGNGLESEVDRLLRAAVPLRLHLLCAVGLLARHQGEPAQTLLTRLAQDAEPSVAAAALARLNAIDHHLVLPLAEAAMQNADPNVRTEGMAAYVALPTPERVTFLAQLLDDVHPRVRGTVRDALFELAKAPELDGPIRQAATVELNGQSWRGQEQAALLLGALDQKSTAARFVQLLESTRGEVMIASAWGLRKFAIRETLPAMLDKATRQTKVRVAESILPERDAQVAHLFEAMGLMKYAPSEPLMRQYIPKSNAFMQMGELSRSAAIWSLGYLHAGDKSGDLPALFVDRVTDITAPPVEMMRVRVAGAIAIGRMGAGETIPKMVAYMGPKVWAIPSSMAIRWAIHEITGELLPEPSPATFTRSKWFLEPLPDTPPNTD